MAAEWRNRPMQWPTIRLCVLVTVGLAVGLTACGGGVSGTVTTPPASTAGGSTLDADRYTSGVCQAMIAWVNDLQASSATIGTQVAGASSLDEAKQDFVTYIDEQVQRTDDLITSVDSLGAPDVQQGAEAHQAVLDLLSQVKSVFEQAKTDAEQLPTSDVNAFLDGIDQLTAHIDSGMSGIGDPFEGLSVPELEQAGNTNPDCQTLGTGS
jgi:hypothetical protein